MSKSVFTIAAVVASLLLAGAQAKGVPYGGRRPGDGDGDRCGQCMAEEFRRSVMVEWERERLQGSVEEVLWGETLSDGKMWKFHDNYGHVRQYIFPEAFRKACEELLGHPCHKKDMNAPHLRDIYDPHRYIRIDPALEGYGGDDRFGATDPGSGGGSGGRGGGGAGPGATRRFGSSGTGGPAGAMYRLVDLVADSAAARKEQLQSRTTVARQALNRLPSELLEDFGAAGLAAAAPAPRRQGGGGFLRRAGPRARL